MDLLSNRTCEHTSRMLCSHTGVKSCCCQAFSNFTPAYITQDRLDSVDVSCSAADNPKILTQCNHHFHLACIYEWLERSQTCPICSRQMSFDEFM